MYNFTYGTDAIIKIFDVVRITYRCPSAFLVKKKRRNKKLHLQYYIIAVIYKDQVVPGRVRARQHADYYIPTLSVVCDFLNYKVH